jgi:hypothetical protein
MRRLRIGVTASMVMLVGGALAGLSGGTVSAQSCPEGCVTASITPASVGAGTAQSVGGVGASVTLTITTEDTGLGSADLTPPSGFAIAPSSPSLSDTYETGADGSDGAPSAMVSAGGVLQLRDLDVPDRGTVSVTFAIAADCGAVSSAAWSLVAESSDSYGGGSLTLDSASLGEMTVTGSCTLAFTQQPTNAVVSTDITSVGFNPSGTPVTVGASDANGASIPGVAVVLTSTPGSLLGTTSNSTVSPGGATFPSIDIATTGYDNLLANGTLGTFTFAPVTSNLFQVTSTATPCTGSCSGSVTGPTVDASASVSNPGSGDFLSLGLGGFTYSCPDRFSPTGYYQSVSGSIGVDLWQSNGSSLDLSPRTTVVTITIPKSEIPSVPPWQRWFLPLRYQVCYASTVPFPGGTLSTTTTIPGYPTSTYIGLLQQCPLFHPDADDVPCVLYRYWTRDGSIDITFLAGPGDIWGTA